MIGKLVSGCIGFCAGTLAFTWGFVRLSHLESNEVLFEDEKLKITEIIDYPYTKAKLAYIQKK